MLSWILFRSDDATHAFSLYRNLFEFESFFRLNMRENTYLVTALILVLYSFMPLLKVYSIGLGMATKDILMFLFTIVGFVLLIIYLKPLDQFIYFQF